jgi:cbb3-type cytochrome c oxidase subunit III
LPRPPGRPASRGLALAALLAAVAAVGAGCGTGGLPSARGDTSRGKQLFVSKCGSCHTLADAGTTSTIGPNLDDAFKPGLDQGFKDSTVRAIVADQIKYPINKQLTKEEIAMPAHLVRGSDVDAVAAYVASVVGKPAPGKGGKITATSGKEIFQTAGCTGCHTLKDAGSSGTVGPNLDQAKPSKSLVVQRVTNGKGAMPSFKSRLSKKQIDAVAQYVSSVAGK